MESELNIRAATEKIWKNFKFAVWGRFLIAKEYQRCLSEARLQANQLEAEGHKPEEVSQRIQQFLEKHCRNLTVIVEGNDVYIEKKSFETRIYFDWRARIRED